MKRVFYFSIQSVFKIFFFSIDLQGDAQLNADNLHYFCSLLNEIAMD